MSTININVSKATMGLDQVDNTSDVDKPVSTAQATADGLRLLKTANLSDLQSASTARTNLGLGSLATQSGTFSGTSSGTNTGDETATTKQTFTDSLTVSPAPLDTMMVQVTDPASTTVKKFSWLNFKTYLLAYFDTIYPRKSVATNSSVISFEAPVVWNTPASPSTSNLTDDLNNAKIGYVQKIYHNKAVEPTYPAGWVKMGTGTYTNSVLNVIFAEWVSGTRVEYWITKPA